MSVWVFGYGSLVSPSSVAETIGRTVEVDDGFVAATLEGYGRRWNYGSLRQRANWDGPNGRVEGGVVVSLGIAVSAHERTNGTVVRVDEDELRRLDVRESDYDRVEVTAAIDAGVLPRTATVVTYVPRPSAIERYEASRRAGRAAVRQGYVDLVIEAFGALGGTALAEYRASTPEPEVPVLHFESRWLEDDEERRPAR